MSDDIIDFNEPIHWPDGIDQQRFLDEYWQKKPLLIRDAFPNFATPLPADELAGLSLETDVTGKIITRDKNGAYHLENGPFSEDRFDTLTGNNWSLLVTDVEKHLPQFATYLQPFRFIADWRIDDLMVSYAPDGASVGAHIDEYDVFLLQASGVRSWSIDERKDISHTLRGDGDLKILDNFQATATWDLNPGDMLYLPPMLAHHGIAKGNECTTWSIGFRAPRMPDIVARLAELISEDMPMTRYTDSSLTPAIPGEISDATLQAFRDCWNNAAILEDHDFAKLLGRCLTESNATVEPPGPEAQSSDEICSVNQPLMQKSPFSQFAWRRLHQEKAMLFVDGTSRICSLELAMALCATPLWFDVRQHLLTENDHTILNELIKAGSLL